MPRTPSYHAGSPGAAYAPIKVTRAKVVEAGCAGTDEGVARKLKKALLRPEGLGKADPTALLRLVRAASFSRGLLEYRRHMKGRYGERGLASRRAVALGQLDAAIEKTLAALRCASEVSSLCRVGDAGLIAALPAIQSSVRVSARLRLGESQPGHSPKGGRRRVGTRAQMVADFRRLGATAREAEYLVTNISPQAPENISGSLGVLSGLS